MVEFQAGATWPPWGQAPPAIHIVGDSNTAGSNGVDTGHVGGWRHPMLKALRAWRDDFELVGTLKDASELIATNGAPWHNAVPGYAIGDVAGAYAGWIAALAAPPDCVVDLIGTNDVPTKTPAQMMAARAAMDAVIEAACPAARRVVLAVLPFVAGTTVGGNLAAWNATVVAYNALLESHCRAEGYSFVDVTGSLGPGDYQADGVHLNRDGQAAFGQRVAEYLDRVVLGQRRGFTLPATFRQTKPRPSIYFPTTAAKLTFANAPEFRPDASIAVAFDWFPTVLTAGAFQEVIQYGAYGAGDFWGIYQNGTALSVYWNNVAGTITGQPQAQVLRKNEWHRIVLIAQLSGADSAVGLYVNGELVGLAAGIAAWNLAQQTTVLGAGVTFGATAPGYVSRVAAFKGASIPRPGSMAAMRAVERDYFLGGSLFGAASVGSWPLGASLANEISGGTPATLGGGAAALAAHPAGTPRRPWEMAILLADGKRGTVALNGAAPAVANVAHTDIRANEVPRLTLQAAGGTGTGLAPACVVTPHVGFTLTGPAGDTSIWAWELPR